MLYNTPKNLDMQVFNKLVDGLKKKVSSLNDWLKGKKWIMGNNLTMADIACAVALKPCFQHFFEPGFRKGRANLAQWFEAFIALPQVVGATGHIKMCQAALKPTVPGAAAAASAGGKKETKKKDDDDFDDLFDDNEEDAAAAQKAAAEAKAKAQKKKEKKPVIAQSLVMFEIKPADSETDLDALAKRVFNIKMDGCYWKT